MGNYSGKTTRLPQSDDNDNKHKQHNMSSPTQPNNKPDSTGTTMADEALLSNPNFFEYFIEGAPCLITNNHPMLPRLVNGAMHIVNSTGKQTSYDAEKSVSSLMKICGQYGPPSAFITISPDDNNNANIFHSPSTFDILSGQISISHSILRVPSRKQYCCVSTDTCRQTETKRFAGPRCNFRV
jgi:hypothetical protein